MLPLFEVISAMKVWKKGVVEVAFSQGSWGAKREREEEVKVELEIERGAIISPVSQSVLAAVKRVLRRSRESWRKKKRAQCFGIWLMCAFFLLGLLGLDESKGESKFSVSSSFQQQKWGGYLLYTYIVWWKPHARNTITTTAKPFLKK